MNKDWDPERDEVQVEAGRERRLALAEDIRKLEAVRERLLAVDEVARTYPKGHKTRDRLENLHLEKVVEELDGELENLYDRTIHPRGT